MAPAIVHLPNGQNLTVTPVFGGLYFKANDLSNHHSSFPPGWTVVLNSEDDEKDHGPLAHAAGEPGGNEPDHVPQKHHIHRYKRPTLHNDHLYISSISNPSNDEFKPATSPTRQIAMMLWATLWWYFHQLEPDPRMTTAGSAKTAEEGRPKGEWRININREGILKGKQLLPKLERMGLIASEDSCVGCDTDNRTGEGWSEMFVSRRSFWQLDARIYLFTLSPLATNTPFPASSPSTSRPNSPNRSGAMTPLAPRRPETHAEATSQGLWAPTSPGSTGPFQSSSNLPTYYPPPPPQYIFTNGIRHPVRPKPPRPNETFYTRYIPSVGQYLSFRVASLSIKPHTHHGPVSSAMLPNLRTVNTSVSDSVVPTMGTLNIGACDTDLLHAWMNDPRVAHFWGEQGPKEHQEAFLEKAMKSRHSFPVIGCWDGKPFGYFEIYWVKEDGLGAHMGGTAGDWDRGLHCLVGEQEFRGAHRVKLWLSALVHWCWLADNRTQTVLLEPRVDNMK
ncbi:hypothetical protein B0A49_04196 [Cryomyces minteri]|uniref:Acyltransferase MbtK/IucB-like conserved domain-containing protein n=1 Tax=Cryomyces minteri TaxID=331657 RepID=A0A4U0XK91_9PEZI|nr:hypothetical protein B0A49_04196 [Cryomyces minteri]